LIISESPYPKYNEPLQINESILCLGDLQIPFHDAKFISNCVRVSHAFGVYTCGWFGDAFDIYSLSIFLSELAKDLKEELDDDESFGSELSSQFKKIFWCNGNHDERMARALMQWLPVDRLRKLLGLGDHVKASDYFYAFIGDDWMATHPKNASVIPGRVPAALALKYRRNVLAFHGHGLAATMIDDLWAVDVGMCADRVRLGYVQLRQNTRPLMQQGAALMLRDVDGVFHLRLLNGMTDWGLEIATGAIWQEDQQRLSRRHSASATRLATSKKQPPQTRTRKRSKK
jgi:hypothetical protein